MPDLFPPPTNYRWHQMSNARRASSEVMESYMGSDFTSTTPRHSIYLIPSPGSQDKPLKPYEPFVMKLWVAIGVPILMLVLGIVLEIAIKLSDLNDGFKVPVSNVFSVFGNVSPQFLASFFPTLLIIPFAIAWRELDWTLRWYQPYIVLNKGNAKAEESVLLDYIALGPLPSIFYALNYKHRLIFWSSLTAFVTYIYQPLAGSIFQIQQRPQTDNMFITSKNRIGLSPNTFDLRAFVAAAGYVDSSVLLNMSDPQFIRSGWVTAKFEYPSNQYINGSVIVDTSGIQTIANCSNPSESPILTSVGTTSFNLSSKSIDGCAHSVSFNSTGGTLQSGVDDVTCPGNQSLDSSLRPVMFWFFQIRDDNGTPEAKTVFCAPTIQAFDVRAVADLGNGSLTSVTSTGNYLPQNNVTEPGGPLNGGAFNGLIFTNITDPSALARAQTIRATVPGSILFSAQQRPNGLQSTFDHANGFLDLTRTLYTRHLSISAQLVYFINSDTPIPASVVSLLPALKIVSLPAHALAILLILTGIIGIVIQVISRRERKRLLLAAFPGSIASIMALTSRSGFGELLLPYDDVRTMEKKLDGLRFRLDRRTGAVVADEVEGERPKSMISDDVTLALLGGNNVRSSMPEPMSSSDLACAVAVENIQREWTQSKRV